MKEGKFWRLDAVSDALLQDGLKELLTMGARTEARIVAHLGEVEARRLHLAMGASSLFDYCLSRLGLSNSEAFHRITAARLARRFPIIFELLERRDVHLTAVCLLRDYLTPENHRELLGEVSHKTRIEIEELLAAKFPKTDVPSRLRRQRAFEPLSAGRYCLQLSVSLELKQKLELARDLMSHTNPSGDLAVVVERALEVLIEKLQSRRFAQAKSRGPRREAQGLARSAKGGDESGGAAPAGPTRRAHLRHDVRRAVVARDGQRCSFVGQDGHRCEARACLEFHHQRAWALGGAESLENLALICRAHNRLLAERELGTARVAEAIERARRRK